MLNIAITLGFGTKIHLIQTRDKKGRILVKDLKT